MARARRKRTVAIDGRQSPRALNSARCLRISRAAARGMIFRTVSVGPRVTKNGGHNPETRKPFSWRTAVVDISIYISFLALVVSATVLYLTHFRPPKIGCIVGSTIGLNHQGDGFSIYLPLTFTNSAHQPGLINRCSVLLSGPAAATTVQYIEWTEFRKYDDGRNQYVQENIAGPLQIGGLSSVSKLCWFQWKNGKGNFAEGTHDLEILVWTENSEQPTIRQHHGFIIGADDALALGFYGAKKAPTIQWIGLDSQIKPNKTLTEHERKALGC